MAPPLLQVTLYTIDFGLQGTDFALQTITIGIPCNFKLSGNSIRALGKKMNRRLFHGTVSSRAPRLIREPQGYFPAAGVWESLSRHKISGETKITFIERIYTASVMPARGRNTLVK
jgi:hypothetical protein